MADERIRAILFDLGDTLLDFGEVDLPRLFQEGGRGAYAYLRSLGGNLPDLGRYLRRHLRAIHWHEFRSRLTGREFNSLDVMDRLCRRMNLRLTREQLLEVCRQWYEPLSRQARVEAGVGEMIGEFLAAGLKIGMVSNTFIPAPVLDRHLEEVGLLRYLPVRVYSCEVGRRKPHRSIFAEALRRLDALPAETMFVGDSPSADVRGANRMGMISVLKDPTGRHERCRPLPRHTVRSLLEIRTLVASYRRGDGIPTG